jgi:hypothetical protein
MKAENHDHSLPPSSFILHLASSFILYYRVARNFAVTKITIQTEKLF